MTMTIDLRARFGQMSAGEQVFERWAQVLRFLLTRKDRSLQLARR